MEAVDVIAWSLEKSSEDVVSDFDWLIFLCSNAGEGCALLESSKKLNIFKTKKQFVDELWEEQKGTKEEEKQEEKKAEERRKKKEESSVFLESGRKEQGVGIKEDKDSKNRKNMVWTF